MALTELQLPNKTVFYNNLQNVASNMKNLMSQWEYTAEFLADMGIADLDAMEIATGDVRTDLVDFRVAINEMIAFFNGTATTQTKVPKDVVDRIRRMIK